MDQFNTFRALRYLRTKFDEGKYLLASEGTDLELEMIDLARQQVLKSLGDISVGNAWLVSYSSNTTLNIAPGNSWLKGLPFTMRDSYDHLVTGSVRALVPGVNNNLNPLGVSYSDSSTGKMVTFTPGVTPSGNYTVVVRATEQQITYQQDSFLENIDLNQSTAEKRRLVYDILIVDTADQTNSPVPYVGDGYNGDGGNNLVNSIDIVVSSTPATNGYVQSVVAIPGKNIDGRSYSVTLGNINTNSILPAANSAAANAFNYGFLVDTEGQIFHLCYIVTGSPSNEYIQLYVDAEVNQPAPVFTVGQTFKVIKGDVYVTDSNTGNSQYGKLLFPISTIEWDITQGFKHPSVISDIRGRVVTQKDFENLTNVKFNITTTGGGTLNLASDNTLLTWSSNIVLTNAFTPDQTITANSQALLEGNSLIYEMNLDTGGVIGNGVSNLTVSSVSGSILNFSGSPNLNNVSPGNTILLSGSYSTITSVDSYNYSVTINPAINATGSATLYLDSYASGYYPKLTELIYTLAVRKNGVVWVADKVNLDPGNGADLGNTISTATLTYIGANNKDQSAPSYSSTNFVTQGVPLNTAISQLDAEIENLSEVLSQPVYDEVTLFPSGLSSGTIITIPYNSRLAPPAQQTYSITGGELEIYVNDLFKYQYNSNISYGDWNAVNTTQISFNFDLPNNSEVHFRIATVGGSSSGEAILGFYDKSIYYSSGLTANTPITLPDGGFFENSDASDIFIIVNDLVKEVTRDFTVVGSSPYTQVQFNYNLPNDSVVRFKEITLSGGGGGGGGGSESLQEAYNNGASITTTTGNPVTINGPGGEKLLVVNGNITVTGVVDPTAIQITPQSSNPLGNGNQGIWVNNLNQLTFENGSSPSYNIIEQIETAQNGSSINSLSTTYANNTGSDIPINTPVYLPSSGNIQPTDATQLTSSICIGITLEDIPNGESGLVAYAGSITNLNGYTHGSYIYLGETIGSLTDLAPSISNGYSAGFQVFKVGIMNGTTLVLQLQPIGTL